jgi:hypothetical protein
VRFFDTDRVTFKVTTTDMLAVPNERTYHRFSDLADDMVDARCYMGFISASRTRLPEGSGLASRRRPSIISCGPFAIAVTIMTRSAAASMPTTGMAATDTSKSESEPAVACA